MHVQLQMASEIAPPEEGEAEGCIQCQRGSKLVLFVTGKCHWGCDYCPLSDNRRETPDMFANERRCTNFDEVIEEGKAMRATGTGITGGDPMLDFKKTVKRLETYPKLSSSTVSDHPPKRFFFLEGGVYDPKYFLQFERYDDDLKSKNVLHRDLCSKKNS